MVAVTAIARQTKMTTTGTMIPSNGTPACCLKTTHTLSHSVLTAELGTLKLPDWTLQDWTMTDELARLDIAGLDIDGRLRRGGHCRTGQ